MPKLYSPEKLNAEVMIGLSGCPHNVIMAAKLTNTPEPGFMGKLTNGSEGGPPICVSFIETADGSKVYKFGSEHSCPANCAAAAHAARCLLENMGLHQVMSLA